MFENKKIFVLGMARSGYEAARLLATKNNEILITDMKEQDPEQVKELESLGVKFVLSETPEDILDNSYNFIVKNPGIHKSHKVILKAKELGIKVVNEVEVGYHFLPKDVKIIAVTGSNGKTTTTSLTYEILKVAKLPVHLAGNIGLPLCGVVNAVVSGDILVIEISSHQLVDMYDFHPNISIFTNITETHLDFFDSYEDYIQTKGKIFNNQTKEDLAVINAHDEHVQRISANIASQKLSFSGHGNASMSIKDNFINFMGDNIVNINDIRIKGVHNYENAMCAITVAKAFGVSDEIIRNVLSTFSGVEHRLEFVSTVNKRDFYNDSKATNPQATIIALNSFNKPVILLLGGSDRKQSFNELDEHLEFVKHIVCYGEVKNRINEWSSKLRINCTMADNLTDAVKAAYNLSAAGNVILLSPASASWDQFKDFEERGNEFKLLIGEIKEV